ncbi:MAG: bifunctional serine/threonine-protein kinase/formylglycine-generating enzyme family protein [Verrucomicrobiota bacterium]
MEKEFPGGEAPEVVPGNAPGAPVIPDHEMIRLIGKGSYGEVWLARGVTGALRAVKVVSRVDFEFDRTFEREFEGIKQFEPISRHHEGLVDVLHIGRNRKKGFYHYVMELGDDRTTGAEILPDVYEPRTLSTDIQRHKRLKMDDCLSYGAFLAHALYHLHEAGLVHRDIKPSNVVFVDGLPKLADIGLVAASGRRTFVGTEGFVPPEGPGTAAADIYSLGMVLYEMSTGKDRLDFPEVPGDFEDKVERKKWRKLNEVICKACAQSPKKRYTNAREMAWAIERIQRFKIRPVRLTTKLARVAVFAGLLAVFLTTGRNADLFASIEANRAAVFDADALKSIPPPGTKVDPGKDPKVVVKTEPKKPPPKPRPKLAKVKIVSDPQGARVTIAGKDWGKTPVTRYDVPVGRIRGKIELAEYRPLKVDEMVEFVDADNDGESDSYQVFGDVLEYWNPPKMGLDWTNSMGVPFRAVGGRHLALRGVNEGEFEAFLRDVGEEYSVGTARIRADEDMIETLDRVVMVGPEAAQGFCDWLTAREKESGYLTSMQRYVVDESIDYEVLDFDFPLTETGIRRVAVFCAIEEAAFAGMTFATTPPAGAEVYLGDELLGTTPFSKNEMVAGDLVFQVKAGGFKAQEVAVSLIPGELKELVIPLEKSHAPVFGRPWENELGMKFVPLRDGLLVSQWETRVRDYEAYLFAKGLPSDHVPPFPQEPDHPVVLVSRDEAKAFCDWLTDVERESGKLEMDMAYRLPTDLEWSGFCGLDSERGISPAARDGQTSGFFPWGKKWPPPKGVANLADRRDGFDRTAPVGSYAPSEFGLHDLAGNVWEWVSDDYGGSSNFKTWAVARGGGFTSADKTELQVSYRNTLSPKKSFVLKGFRCVIAREE